MVGSEDVPGSGIEPPDKDVSLRGPSDAGSLPTAL